MSEYTEDLQRELYRWTSDDEHLYRDKAIYFDMDGTIADLYGIEGWLDMLIAEDPSPYYDAAPLVDPQELWDFCALAAADGFRIGIISWLSKYCRQAYAREIINSKLAWCNDFLPVFHEIGIAPYGMPKSTCALVQSNSVLIDDEVQNRNEWQSLAHNRIAYDTSDMMGTLSAIRSQISGNFYQQDEWHEMQYDTGEYFVQDNIYAYDDSALAYAW